MATTPRSGIQPIAPPKNMVQIGNPPIWVDERFAKNRLDANNEKLFGLREKLVVNSLETSILDYFINASKYVDEQGKVQYDTKRVQKEQFINLIMDSITYHIHNRHFKNMPEDLTQQLSKCVDFNGDKYTDIMAQAMTGFDRTSLEELLGNNPLSNQAAYNSALQVGGNYLNIQASKVLNDTYKDNIPGIRDGLNNLASVFELDPEVYKVKDLPSLGERELMQNYLRGLNRSWAKVNNPDQR
ncbi:MAG: hypothetical protein Q8R37_04690 [Nanoarchaeota archaeon]|nr:hypothetical protein [Nanoarchaeota archaeon]